MFDALGEWFADDGFRGCMFIKASSEYQEAGHPIYTQCAEHKRLLFAHMRDLTEKTGAVDADMLARQLLLLKEGAIVTAHLGYTKCPAGDAKLAAQVLMAASIAGFKAPQVGF